MWHAGATVGSGRIGWILQNPGMGSGSGGEIGRLGEGRGEGFCANHPRRMVRLQAAGSLSQLCAL
jgi:hypothetical protein